jgi:hypothetical protein
VARAAFVARAGDRRLLTGAASPARIFCPPSTTPGSKRHFGSWDKEGSLERSNDDTDEAAWALPGAKRDGSPLSKSGGGRDLWGTLLQNVRPRAGGVLRDGRAYPGPAVAVIAQPGVPGARPPALCFLRAVKATRSALCMSSAAAEPTRLATSFREFLGYRKLNFHGRPVPEARFPGTPLLKLSEKPRFASG